MLDREKYNPLEKCKENIFKTETADITSLRTEMNFFFFFFEDETFFNFYYVIKSIEKQYVPCPQRFY
jgi:hypothetical protein